MTQKIIKLINNNVKVILLISAIKILVKQMHVYGKYYVVLIYYF